MRYLGLIGVALFVIMVTYMALDNAALNGRLGTERDAGEITGAAVPASKIIARQDADDAVAPEGANKQILFGDLHVHSTYSPDAFLWALPINMGQGVHPVADACDYARYCSAIDFWAITDHAEGSTPYRWAQTKDSIRQCQARAGDPSNPDLVSMIGFEWTQIGDAPETHYGHKNVVFLGLDDDDVSLRPIAAAGASTNALRGNNPGMPLAVSLLDFDNRRTYWEFSTFIRNVKGVPLCADDTPSNELPIDCFEAAATPGDLVRKLEEQGLDPLIIPHGTTWGMYTPPGTTWDKQLKPEFRPEKFRLIELYSGHGNSEEYRDFVSAYLAEDGVTAICGPKTEIFTPSCYRVGEIIEERCLDDGDDVETCAARAEYARNASASMGPAYHKALGGEAPEDYLDSGQCPDCYLPAFHYRPLTSVQYGLAISRFDENPEDPIRFNWGFISSSDNHRSRPGTGYKEVARRLNTEASGAISQKWRDRLLADDTPGDANVYPMTVEEMVETANLSFVEFERQSSFWLTGGLAAVHTDGRSREDIWDALRRRETFATSGPRMLLWFDRVANDGATAPMGASLSASESGAFKVKAVGSFKQKPGCPDFAVKALGADRIKGLCAGECYNPTSERNIIERIEIVRIRPQVTPDENVADLIEDPYLVHECKADQAGCTFEFTDPDFTVGARDALYYARAIQEPSPTINAEPIKCERDETGACIKATICYGDWRTGDDECTDMKDVRAWSSPIYLSYKARSEAKLDVDLTQSDEG
ncbi:MAG: DUF3604 domain-containing protein [Pseudomonadota bacterium]